MVVGRINGVVALTGFSYEEVYGRFAGTKKSGRNNRVVVLTRLSKGGVPLYFWKYLCASENDFRPRTC